ncbi:MAG: TonB-dependent receptor [Ginsengibacter sp.]
MQLYKKVTLLIIALIFTVQLLNAQVYIKGIVVDAISRQPLQNATVLNIEVAQSKTVTDQYGNFYLKGNSGISTLLISYIGYRATTFSTEGKDPVKIELQPDVVNLKDVFVLQNNILSKFSTLSKIDLDLKPVRNTQELLRLVPGLFIAQHAGGGKAEQIFLRGFDCDHGTDVQVSVDGMPVNMVSHAHGQGYADSHFIIPETINNIDFGAGPYYTQHGNLNTAGYVAFSTFNNIPKSRIQIEGGRFNTFRTLAMLDILKKNKDNQSAYIASEFYYTDGPTVNKQNFNRFNIFAKYNLALQHQNQLTLSLSGFKSMWDASGQVPSRAVESGLIERFGSIDPTEGGHTERYNAKILLNHSFKNGSTWENQAYYSRNIFSLFSDFTFYLADSINADEINQAEKRNIFGYLSSLSIDHHFAHWSLTSNYGAGLRYDATNNTKLSHVTKRSFLEFVKLGNIKEFNGFAYVQQQANIGKLLVDAGVRVDQFDFNYIDKLTAQQRPGRSKSIISPKLNIQYTINSQIQLFAKTGKGFHSNDTRVVIANEGRDILPAAYGSDIGFIVKPTDRLLVNIAAWYLYLSQEFVYVGDDGNIEPSGKTRREGIDMIARYQFSKYLFANVNVNVTKPRAIGEEKGHDYIPLAPSATSTGGLFYKVKEGFNGGLTYRYIKSRPANEDNSIVAKGYFILDGSFNYTKPKYEIGIAIENMFNTEWNEAQFATTSQLRGEPFPVTELNFTPGTPFFARLKFAVFF